MWQRVFVSLVSRWRRRATRIRIFNVIQSCWAAEVISLLKQSDDFSTSPASFSSENHRISAEQNQDWFLADETEWCYKVFICNTLYNTQESTKIQNEIFITAFVSEHLWNITPQSLYKYWMYFWQSLRETVFNLLVSNTCWKRGEFMDIQYQCHSRFETSKTFFFNWGKHRISNMKQLID